VYSPGLRSAASQLFSRSAMFNRLGAVTPLALTLGSISYMSAVHFKVSNVQ